MKQKWKIAILVGLLVVAAGVWRWNSQDGASNGTDHIGLSAQNSKIITVEDPNIQWERIDKARKAEYKSSGRNIFSEVAQAAPQGAGGTPKPAKSVLVVNNPCGIYGPCKPGPPPPPPPLLLPANVKCFGYGVVPNGTARRAFFHDKDGDIVYVVSEGEVLLNRYRILKIGNANLEFEEISSGRTASAPCEEQAGTPPLGGPSG